MDVRFLTHHQFIDHFFIFVRVVQMHDVRGVRRVHAELTLGHRISVGRQAVEGLMRRANLQGLSGRPRYRRVPKLATATDRVQPGSWG